MATINHSFVSAIADGLDATLVRPSDWNAAHTFTGITEAELGYLSGVTSAIQTQLTAKAASSHTHAQSDITNLVADLLTLTNAVAAKQTSDATLTALAAANWAANAIPIGSGADTLSQVTFAANMFPARASTGNLEAKTLSDFALTILDDADAAAVRTTIGAGTGSGNALTANPLSQFAATTSAQLLATLTNPTGTGLAVFATLPTFTTGLTTPVVTLTQGTITADAPGINHTVTWNDAAIVFTGWKQNITNTASASGSKSLDLQVGGTSKFFVWTDSSFSGLTWSATGFYVGDDPDLGSYNAKLINPGLLYLVGPIGLGSGSSPLAFIHCDAYNTIAYRDGATANAARIYRTWTDDSNYERLALQTGAGYVELAAETAGTGTADLDVRLTPAGTGNVNFPGGVLLKTRAALTNGAAASAGTLANAPAVGNPTKWIPINDNGTTRYIPAW